MAPQPTPSDLHSDKLLTDFSVQVLQSEDQFVADRVFPRKGVMHRSDTYATFPRADFLRSQMRRRANGAATDGIGYTVSSGSYECDDWGLHHDVTDMEQANAEDVYDLFLQATELLTMQELIRREQEWVTAFFTTGVWTTDVTGATDFTQWSAVNSTPIENITSWKETVEDSTGFEPNTLVIGKKVWNVLKNHDDILARIDGGATTNVPAQVRRQQVAELFELDNLHIAGGIRNTAGEGETASYSRIVGSHALLVYVDPQAPRRLSPTAGMTFVWDRYIGSVSGRRIKRWRDEDTESERIEIQANWDQKVTSADLGHFSSTVIA